MDRNVAATWKLHSIHVRFSFLPFLVIMDSV